MGGLFIFLGTGASAGVPVIGCRCNVCRSNVPYNRRLRSSGLIQIDGRFFVIDAGPDFREQALTYQIDRVDGLLLTHTHFDHIAGLDDLRIYSFRQHSPIPCLLSQESLKDLQRRYSYLFQEGKSTTVRFSYQVLDESKEHTFFEKIPIAYCHYKQADMKVTGYKIGNFAYISDIREYEPSIFTFLQGVDYLVLSALHQGPSQVHFSLDEAVDFARKIGARQTRLTHLSHLLDYKETNQKLPSDVQLGYDGLSIAFEV